ncbi:MAG: DUF4864 domain-containing protein [Alphaproteobacteria bacterium]|nr:DUF4864 domain-containing protein [Alphaproteobacteria bacterium]
MRRWIVAVALLLAAPAAAQVPAGPGERAAIRQVISDQIQAFRRDDAAGAFAFAAPAIQAMFGTPENFLAMVRNGYRPVYRPRAVEFRDLRETEGTLIQRVLVVGPDGVAEVALYVMERQADGSWRIAGCYLTKAEERTT